MPEIDPSVPAKRWSLGAEGQHQARKLAGVFSPQPEVVVSSTEPKAFRRVNLLPSARRPPCLNPTSACANTTVARWVFSTEKRFKTQSPGFFACLTGLYSAAKQPTKRARFDRAVEHHCAQHAGAHLAIVCHGTVLSLWVIGAWATIPLRCGKHCSCPRGYLRNTPNPIRSPYFRK